MSEDIQANPDSDLTTLYPSTEFKNPLSTFNNIAPEKGSQLLNVIENWIGEKNMTVLMRNWIAHKVF